MEPGSLYTIAAASLLVSVFVICFVRMSGVEMTYTSALWLFLLGWWMAALMVSLITWMVP